MALPEDQKLTFEDVAAFLEEKLPGLSCRRCNNVEWNTGRGNEIKGFIPVGTDEQGDFKKSERSIPVHYLICTNCGNVEFVATKVIRRWKAARRTPQQSERGSDA